ncbi:SusD/RagB family nutrient-binding outer membrane lipoprotein [Pedobacter hartonius]|uniref:Starch-binding associating with outer membrane n=1 Tax=Pedobacter hartonius TaxID=425514 RepID=A0A1H4F600_9SPHI|nr:SusD/RagB family nutrient-binding outer membrane lipoprotein [Pedobacter hartonius]SEA92689.1 Starch-binding associating with outer membrane [Pedobacter hartonius]
MKFITINKIKKSQLLVLLMVAVTFSSCKKGFLNDDLNNDSSQLQNPLPSGLLPGIIQSTGYIMGGDASRYPANFMQQVTGVANQSVLVNRYEVSADDVDDMWTAGFYSIMGNTNAMINLAKVKDQGHYGAVGKIMLAYNLGVTTDMWGDVPYSEAFLGKANLQPKYDTQQSIYAAIDQLLTEAATSLVTSDGSPFQPAADDLLFGGDLGLWTRFAHSLKAKFYLHLAKRDISNYTKALTEVPLGFKAGESAAVKFSGTSVPTQNPWFQFNDQRPDIGFTGTLYNLLKNANDPRLAVYQTVNGGDASLGPLYGSPNSSVYLMSYDELKFIEAEAQFQGMADKTAAAAAYNIAVAENLTRTVKDASYAGAVSKTAADITLNDIMTQKYFALFLNAEVWTDYRRTGLPALTATPGSALNGTLPRSLLYPIGEQRYNPNTPKNTSLSRRVWWDVQ